MARFYPMGHFLHYLEQSPQTLVMLISRGKVVCYMVFTFEMIGFCRFAEAEEPQPSLSMLISVLVHNGIFVNLLFLIQRVHILI